MKKAIILTIIVLSTLTAYAEKPKDVQKFIDRFEQCQSSFIKIKKHQCHELYKDSDILLSKYKNDYLIRKEIMEIKKKI